MNIKNKGLFIIAIFLSTVAQGQITKGNWMVGGSGHISSQRADLYGTKVRGLDIKASPTIGYFFIEKFAAGTKLGLAYSKIKFNGGVSKSTQIGIGPFMRYYFLNSGNRVNLIGETSYEYGYNSSNNGASDNHNIFTISAGPVIYFNSSVGIELTANYELLNGSTGTASAKTVYFNIGFQIHLEKRRLSINYKY